MYQALQTGAAGYLLEGGSTRADRRRRAGLRAGRDGRSAPELAGGLVSEIRLRATNDAPALTERESEILKLIAEGKSLPEIARELYLGVTTVKTHVQHLYEKLGVSDRAAAVAEAMRRRLIE